MRLEICPPQSINKKNAQGTTKRKLLISLITCITLLSLQPGYLLKIGLDIAHDNRLSSQNPLIQIPRVAGVPAAPVLAAIKPVQDYDPSTYLIWSIVSGASSYKVYRNTSKILSIGSLTPIGTPTSNKYMDNDTSRIVGIYWYAVVATNGSGDSGLSNSESTQYGLSDPELVYWTDFNNNSLDLYPAGWTCVDSLLDFNAFRVRNGSFGAYRETPYLQVTDNQNNAIVTGYVNFASPVSVGDISFDLSLGISDAGSIPQLYYVYLETSSGTPIVSFQLAGNKSTHTCTMSLGGITAPTTFMEYAWYHIYIGFDGTTMNLMVNGTTWLTGVSYAGGTIQRLHITTTPLSGGGELSLDNFLVIDDNDIPQISHPGNLTYVFGTVNQHLTWTVADFYSTTKTYTIFVNNTANSTGFWLPNIPFNVPLDNWGIGYYNVSCVVSDNYGGINSSWALVTVNDVMDITRPDNITYNSGQTGYTLSWTGGLDLINNNMTFNVTQNGNPFDIGYWIPDLPIIENVEGLPVGTYNFSCTLYDGLGASNMSWAIVTVNDIPQMTVASDQTIYFGQMGYELNWTVNDGVYSYLNYTIKINGSDVASGSWIPAVPITFSLDYLTTGVYSIICTVSDGYGGSNSSSTIVNVIDHAPVFGNPTIGVTEIGRPILISVTVTDLVPLDRVILIWSNDSGNNWHNVTMSPEGLVYTGYIPAQPAGANVIFHFYARDIYGSMTLNTNEGQYYALDVPPQGLDWWVLLVLIGAAAAIVTTSLLVRSSSYNRQASGNRQVSQVIRETTVAATTVPTPSIKSKGFVAERPVLAFANVGSKVGETDIGVQAFRGGQIEGLNYIYKIKVKNNTENTITDVSIHVLNYPRDTMTLEGEELRREAKIEPKGFRSLEFKLTPHNDCVEGQLVSVINFMDSKNEIHTLPVEPLEIRSVCDLMGPYEITEENFDKLVGPWASTRVVFNFEGEDPRLLLADVPAILRSKNFFPVNLREFPTETMYNAEVKGIAIGKYTRMKLGIDVIIEANTVLMEGTVICTGLAEDPSMLVACLQEVLGAFKKRLERFWDTRVTKLRDVINVQHMLLIHKESGTAIMSQNFAGEKIDGNLISGFLTAMTSFQSEIAPKKRDGAETKKGFLLDYADFKILMEDGDLIRTALILVTDPSDSLKDRLTYFTQRYESLFRNKLQVWRGNLNDVEGGDILFEEIFEMSLLYPHVVNPNPGNLGNIARAIYAMGQAISKDRPFFFLATLMDYAIKGLQESQQRIFSTIYDLKKNHAIEPTIQSVK